MISRLFVIGSLVGLILLSFFLIQLMKPSFTKDDVAIQMKDALANADISCISDDDCVLVNICAYTCDLDCKYVNKDDKALARLTSLERVYRSASGESCGCSCSCGATAQLCVDGECIQEFWPFSLTAPKC